MQAFSHEAKPSISFPRLESPCTRGQASLCTVDVGTVKFHKGVMLWLMRCAHYRGDAKSMWLRQQRRFQEQ
jgi:hypothetical protein